MQYHVGHALRVVFAFDEAVRAKNFVLPPCVASDTQLRRGVTRCRTPALRGGGRPHEEYLKVGVTLKRDAKW